MGGGGKDQQGGGDAIMKSGPRVFHAGRLDLLTKDVGVRKASFSGEVKRLNPPAASNPKI